MDSGFAPSRRALVVGGAALAVLQTGLAATAAAAAPLKLHDMADWERQLGQRFSVGGGTLKLVAVRKAYDGRRPRHLARKANFVALFEGDVAAVPADGATVAVSHPTLGTTALYLQHGTSTSGKARLKASFN